MNNRGVQRTLHEANTNFSYVLLQTYSSYKNEVYGIAYNCTLVRSQQPTVIKPEYINHNRCIKICLVMKQQ
jgi:hypothetical protein